jgi:hypothetical protein
LWGYVQGDIWDAHPNTYVLLWNGTERPALQWLRSYVVPPPVPTLISPVRAANVPRNPKLLWRSTETAVLYGVQIAADSSFSSIVLDLTVTDTLLNLFPLDSNKKFYWHVYAANERDTSEFSAVASFTTGNQIAAVKGREGVPTQFQLSQNYPNQFNPTTQINYSVPQSGSLSLKVYNLLGVEVASLFDGVRQVGNYEATFDGRELASGVYLYKLRANNFIETKKLLLLK